jgi:hypothetical protein
MLFKKLEVETTANEINYLLFILQLDNLLSVLVVSTSSRTIRFVMQKPKIGLAFRFGLAYDRSYSYILVEMTKPHPTYSRVPCADFNT